MADNHWRNTANETKFFFLDARAFTPFPVLMVVKSWFIFAIGVIFLFFFFILDRQGLNFPNFLRKLRSRITGPIKNVRRVR